MDNSTLANVFADLRNGNRDSFVALYEDMGTPIYTLAYRILQDQQTAEDVTQEVFIKLFSDPPSQKVSNLRAWIFQMTRNLSIDKCRKKRTTVDIDGTDIASKWHEEDLSAHMDIEKAVLLLPDDEREIISLHLSAGLGFQEISGIIGKSLPSTYRSYKRALKTLRQYLKGDQK
ncbi:MAG: RNA polymerase sigma factor [Dehalococcoidales bacterium]|nr:RNA polymerase sigma factor [Dehalococcoidales bacterium]